MLHRKLVWTGISVAVVVGVVALANIRPGADMDNTPAMVRLEANWLGQDRETASGNMWPLEQFVLQRHRTGTHFTYQSAKNSDVGRSISWYVDGTYLVYAEGEPNSTVQRVPYQLVGDETLVLLEPGGSRTFQRVKTE